MRYARALIPTLRDVPADAASASHVLLGDYHLAPTHEEIITDLARHAIPRERSGGQAQAVSLPLNTAANEVLELVCQAQRANASEAA